jgi:hypothetical protein
MTRYETLTLAIGVAIFLHACWTFIRSRFD